MDAYDAGIPVTLVMAYMNGGDGVAQFT